jgi:hypothetical protein
MQKGKLDNIRILESTTVDLMTTIHYPEIPIGYGYPDSSQGLIWYWEYFGNRVVWGHWGGFDGATTAMFYDELEKSGVIVLANIRALQGVSRIVSYLFDYAASITTGVTKRDENMVDVFTLRQNYPNPFNSSTTIEYDLPKAGHIRLVIYDLLGRQIRTLIDTQQPPGHFRTTWNGSDQFNHPVSTGMYFCRMEAGEFGKVIKLLL